MAKINKKNTDDVFAGIKYVDKLLNEAANVGNPPKTLTFEEKLKNKLKGGINEAEVNTKTNDPSYNYEYNYNEADELPVGDEDKIVGGDHYNIGEDEENFEDIANDLEGISDDFDDLSHDFENGEGNNEHESEEDEFDFTEDAALMEAILSEVEPAIETPDDVETPAAGGVDMAGEVGASGGAAVPAEAASSDELGSPTPEEVGAETGEEIGDPGAGLGSESGVSVPSSPEMGGGAEPSGMENQSAEMQSSPIDGGEQIDQLIADLVSGTETPDDSTILGENAMGDLGYENAKDEDIKSKVKGMKKESELKLTKLGDKDITGNIASAPGKRTPKKGAGLEGAEDLGDEDITSGKVKEGGAKTASQPSFSSVVKENEQKTKALYTLAEKVITLEDEVANLKFAKFKLEKVNAVLTLLPELKLSTREKLVEKFDGCKSYAETKKLYTEVASMVKDYKRGSLNEAVSKVKTSEMKYFGEATEENKGTLNENQERINMLMGIKGSDDAYGNF
jgi:hypothetical protein